MEICPLQKLVQKFNLKEHLIYKIFLSRSNFLNYQLMIHNNDGFFVEQSYFDKIINADISFKNTRINEGTIYKEAKALIPFDLNPRIYFLLNEDVIVYIGQTNIISSRIATHIGDKIFDKVATFEIKKDELIITEAINILYYMPLYNKDILSDESYFRFIIKYI